MNQFQHQLRAEELIDVTNLIWSECLAIKAELVNSGAIPLDQVDGIVDKQVEQAIVGFVGQEKLEEARKVFDKFRRQLPPGWPRRGRKWGGD